ncbi:MAG: flagellar export protein FliJ [Sedimenticola sp.]|uniref:Flagellar FliJ protein n=1 Tax=Sedimenticola thiotaurini TaxID=1543721 RepID=A0A558D260_9GAMM|nr:flagellar export protein FliJ [Sedimenticola sp.]TVT55114.1 MAG: flagellar export protein FliJ [Sedimenticola thiotaurini]MCW8881090.1 flagellar export protein FliJ [Sedimenticola sp.]MCW8920942.1 flagellar export protein FliJ [Sedimenticola sp.]MCW8947376.1 flagellar export protein FliJ [Sedimenticola sp.]
MVPSKRFQPVKRVAESRESDAARELGHSQKRMRDQEAKLEDLKRYHQEYLERFETTARQGMSASQMQEYRVFLEKLDTAIREQEKVVLASKSECVTRKEQWQQKRVRTQALGKVMDRFKSAELKVQEKREQDEADERSQRGPRKS